MAQADGTQGELDTSTWRNVAAEHAAREPRRVTVLPPELANQIAAGEVVERPASVVKELVENSLDAGASRVEVTVDNGGRDLIRVDDDGCGMEREDALRALERHATSKIRSVDDLFKIATLGFRGEAVPSIASVSRFELKTKPHGALSGTRVEVAGGQIGVVEDVGMAAGTSITIRDLFYNTPARLKFLKTPGTESRHITEMLIRMGLSRPDVRIRLRRDGKVRLDLAPVKDLKDRVLDVMGREVFDVLYPTYEYPAVNGVVARGYYSKPGHKQRTPNNIYTFVNGRYVSDSTVRAAIKGAYGALMEKGRYPSVVLFLDVPHDMVDINVHPAKTEVRFHDTNSIYRAVYHAIADALAEGPWVQREGRAYQLQPYQSRDAAAAPQAGAGAVAGATSPGGEVASRERFVKPSMATMTPLGGGPRRASELLADGLEGRVEAHTHAYRDPSDPYFAKGRAGAALVGGPGAPPEAVQQGFTARGAQPLAEPEAMAPVPAGAGAPVDGVTGAAFEAAAVATPGQGGYFSALKVIGQFKRQYIVCEDASGLVVIDQHAAHERIGYERLKKIFATEHKESQPLLFPKRIELDTLRADTLSDNLEFFAKAGFEIEHFGGSSYVLKAVPAIFQKANIDKIVRDAIDDLGYQGRSTRMDEAMDAVLSRMACHSVVRGPTTLTEPEMYGLFEQMDAIDFAANCPHGRPVYFRMSLHELESSFERR
jgi:DNA mismatch repair protein MutL